MSKRCEMLFEEVSYPSWSDAELGTGPIEYAFRCKCCGRIVDDVEETYSDESDAEGDGNET